MTRLTVLLLAAGSSLFAQKFMNGVPGVPSTLKPDQLKDVGFDQKLDNQLPLELTFRDETGRDVKLGDFFGQKPVIIAPVYYECPMLCSQILNGLVSSMRAVSYSAGADYTVVAVSFDPKEKHTVAGAKRDGYLKRYGRSGAEAGFHFLTGDQPQIDALMTAMGFRYQYDPVSKQFAHASGVLVATPSGRISRVLYGVDYAPRDLRLALVESAENRIGTPVDALMLFCFHYDPSTGKYSSIVMNILRLCATATILALGILIFVLIRKERRTRIVPRTV